LAPASLVALTASMHLRSRPSFRKRWSGRSCDFDGVSTSDRGSPLEQPQDGAPALRVERAMGIEPTTFSLGSSATLLI